MLVYDNHLDKITDEYNAGCQHYKCDTGRVEVCKRCDTYCEEYLEDVDLEDIAQEISELEQVEEDSCIYANCQEKLNKLYAEIKRRIEIVEDEEIEAMIEKGN